MNLLLLATIESIDVPNAGQFQSQLQEKYISMSNELMLTLKSFL